MEDSPFTGTPSPVYTYVFTSGRRSLSYWLFRVRKRSLSRRANETLWSERAIGRPGTENPDKDRTKNTQIHRRAMKTFHPVDLHPFRIRIRPRQSGIDRKPHLPDLRTNWPLGTPSVIGSTPLMVSYSVIDAFDWASTEYQDRERAYKVGTGDQSLVSYNWLIFINVRVWIGIEWSRLVVLTCWIYLVVKSGS